ncbi:MAG: hypothetical protein J6Y72_10585 [Bacteroidales bacterium]|nr:hypothetical protein [Bacteroidales bacterium]
MKKINILFALAAALVAVNAVAQGYTRIQFNFAPQVMEIKDVVLESGENAQVGWEGAQLSTPGFGLGIIKGIAISENNPLFLELGGNLTFLHKKGEDSSNESYSYGSYSRTYTMKYNFFNISIPVNLAYRINVADAFSIQPFAGLNMKVNILGKAQYDYNVKYSTKYGSDSDSGSYDLDFFAKTKVDDNYEQYFFGESDDHKANRFQLGLNIGCGFNIAKILYVGYTFQPDLVKYSNAAYYDYDGHDEIEKTYKVKTRSNVITVGINF